jgi:hypothetical protein
MAIFKRHFDILTGLELSLEDISKRGLVLEVQTVDFKNAGVEVRGNSSEEILGAVKEMLNHLESTNPLTELERDFRARFQKSLGLRYGEFHGDFLVRIPKSFLENSKM